MKLLNSGAFGAIGGLTVAIIALLLFILFYHPANVQVTGGIPSGAVVAYADIKSCPDGWKQFDDGAGRVIIGAGSGSNKDETGKVLSRYSPSQTGGQESSILKASNLPPHTHKYNDIYYSERGGSVTVPNNLGSNGSDSDNKGFQIVRTTLTDSSKASGFTNLPPYVALLLCEKT